MGSGDALDEWHLPHARSEWRDFLRDGDVNILSSQSIRLPDGLVPLSSAPRPTRFVWYTKDGRTIPLQDMVDKHVLNAIHYTIVNSGPRETVDILVNEAKRRGIW